MNDGSKRVALVTGANKGIGLEIARRLAQEGMTVLLGARNPELGERAAATLREAKLDVQVIEIDLTRSDTIDAAAASIADKFQRLDVLVNNAGILEPTDGPPSTADLDTVRRVIDVNFFGTLLVTRAMLPLLRKSDAGRIVSLSSGLGSLAVNADPQSPFAPFKLIGYNTSKAAVNMMTIQLAVELKDTPIKVNAANPGYTATDMTGHQGYQTVEQGAAEAVRLALLPADGPTGSFSDSSGPQPW